MKMNKPKKEYLNLKIYKSVVELLRKYEKRHNLKRNISLTIKHLLENGD